MYSASIFGLGVKANLPVSLTAYPTPTPRYKIGCNILDPKEWFTIICSHLMAELRGVEMGPLLVLVSPGFRENVVVTCKIESFLCSLDNLLQKKRNCFLFENQISKWALI